MERRQGDRIATNLQLNCRVPALPRKGVMMDVSREGCRLSIPLGQVESGSTVLMDLPGSSLFPGTVVWLDGIQAGVKFDKPPGRTTSIALGLEDPEPEPEPDYSPYVEQSRSSGLVRHWMRRIAGCFS